MIFSNELPDSAVQVTLIPITEVRSLDEFSMAISKFVNSEIPGFVVRAAGLTSIGEIDNESLAKETITQLEALEARRFYIRQKYPQVAFKPTNGLGTLHTDTGIFEPGHNFVVNVHTIDEGSGQVTLTNPGRTIVDSSNQYHSTGEKAGNHQLLENTAHIQILGGFVDPEIVSPIIYTTELKKGDTTIFTLESPAGPTMHRFDTSSERRSASSSLIEPLA